MCPPDTGLVGSKNITYSEPQFDVSAHLLYFVRIDSPSRFDKYEIVMTGNLYGVWGAFLNQWKVIIRTSNHLNFLIQAVPTAYVIAWVADRSDNSAVLALVLVGVPLMVVWQGSVFRMGWSLSIEIPMGTLELTLATRTPLALIMLGKALAITVFIILSSLVAFLVVVAVFRELLDIADVGLFIPSLGIALFCLFSGAFIFAPLTVWVRGRPGFFSAIMPFGVAFSGFLYPVSLLPDTLEPLSWLLSTSWAMRAVISSIEGGGSMADIAGYWTVAILISIAYWGLTLLLFKKVVARVRATGALGTF